LQEGVPAGNGASHRDGAQQHRDVPCGAHGDGDGEVQDEHVSEEREAEVAVLLSEERHVRLRREQGGDQRHQRETADGDVQPGARHDAPSVLEEHEDEPGHRGPFHRPARERLRQVEGVIASGIEDEDEGDDVKRRDPQERAACDGTLERRGHRLRG